MQSQARRSQRSLITQVDASSDEQFLLRPNSGRHVVPRTDGALFVAGLLREVGPTQRETDAEFSSGSRPTQFHSQPQVEGVIDALQQDLEGSCEVEGTQSLLVAPADLNTQGGCVPQPAEVSAGGSIFPQPHPAEAERGGPVRVQNRFTPLDVEADAIPVMEMCRCASQHAEQDAGRMATQGTRGFVAQGSGRPAQETEWEALDSVNLHEVFEMRFRVLQNCPHHLRGRFRHASRCALEARDQAARAGDRVMELRAWKLFCLLPFWLLQRPESQGRVGKVELCDRFDKFGEGHWSALHEAACRQVSKLDFKREDRPEPNLEERAPCSAAENSVG